MKGGVYDLYDSIEMIEIEEVVGRVKKAASVVAVNEKWLFATFYKRLNLKIL